MFHTIWQARLTKEEWDKLNSQDLEQMCDDLEIFWEHLKTHHLDKYVRETEGG